MPKSETTETLNPKIIELRSDADASEKPLTEEQQSHILRECKTTIESSDDLKSAIAEAQQENKSDNQPSEDKAEDEVEKKRRRSQSSASSTAHGNIKYGDEGIIKKLFNNTDKIETLKGTGQSIKLFVIGAILLPIAPPLSTAVGALIIVAGSALILSPLAEGAFKTYQNQAKSKGQDSQNNGPLILTKEDIEKDLKELESPSSTPSPQSLLQISPRHTDKEPSQQ